MADHTEKVIYSVEELLSIRSRRPEAPAGLTSTRLTKREKLYFHFWKKLQKLLQRGPDPREGREVPVTIHKYSFAESNREFKKRWLYEHKSIRGLKELPRWEVRVMSPYVTFLMRYFRTVKELERKLENLRPKLKTSTVSTKARVIVPKLPVIRYTPKGTVPRRKAVRIERDTTMSQIYQTPLGGQSQVLPMEHHWKYWYFLRMRGTFCTSKHHPYEDEIG
jgi:hypothetical protein